MRELEEQIAALLRALDAAGELLDEAARLDWLAIGVAGDGRRIRTLLPSVNDRLAVFATSLDGLLESLIAARLAARLQGLRRLRAASAAGPRHRRTQRASGRHG